MLRVVDHLHRVDNLHIAGAPAQMAVQGLGDLLAGHLGVLVGQVLDAQHQPRRAEPALKAGGGLEGVGVELAFGIGNPFQGGDRFAFGRPRRDRAGLARLAVDQRQTAAALPLGRTGVLERLDLAGFAQNLEEGLAGFDLDLAFFAVEKKGDRFHAVHRVGVGIGGRCRPAGWSGQGRADVVHGGFLGHRPAQSRHDPYPGQIDRAAGPSLGAARRVGGIEGQVGAVITIA